MATTGAVAHATTPSNPPAGRRWHPAVHPASTLLLGVVLTLVHGMTPWAVASSSTWFRTVADIRCGALSVRSLLEGTCVVVGGVHGAEVGNGWSFVLAGTAVNRVTGIPAEWAFVVVALTLMCLGIVGTVRLLARWGVRTPVAMLAAVAYLSGPSLLGMRPFGSTYWGMVVLPFAVWASLWIVERVGHRAPWRSLLLVAVWSIANLLLISLDGYAYVMAQAVVGLLLLVGLRGSGPAIAAERIAAFALANALGYLGYRAVGPGSLGEASSIDLFRAMGADLVTFVQPTDAQWWAGATGMATSHADLWGDGSNATYNYVGLLVLGLAITGAVIAFRRRSAVAAWAVIALIALVLSWGPSLKLDEIRGPLVPPVTYDSYLMPESAAALTLPSQWLYESLPGMDMMRATYRWFVVTRLGMIVLAAFAVERLLRRGGWRAIVGAGVGAVAVVELLPNIPAEIRESRERAEMVQEIDATVIEPLAGALPDGARVVIAPNASGGNDFFASYLATGAGVTVYNIGGDKSLAEARGAWPEPVMALLDGTQSVDPTDVLAVLSDGTADALVVPYFDLRWSIESWPPSAEFSEPGLDAAELLSEQAEFDVVEDEWFAVVTLASDR